MRPQPWQLYLPSWIIIEAIYLLRHPRTYRPHAVAVAIPIAALSYLLFFVGVDVRWIYLTQVAAVVLYYVAKFTGHKKARVHKTIKRITS